MKVYNEEDLLSQVRDYPACQFCGQRVARGVDFCSNWCERSENGWIDTIRGKLTPRERNNEDVGREWLSLGEE